MKTTRPPAGENPGSGDRVQRRLRGRADSPDHGCGPSRARRPLA